MCTLSIWREPEEAGYRLWFNRDEKHTRAAEHAPRAERTSDGVGYVAPRDGERGGTWLIVNERGLTVCVLNDYEAPATAPGRRSRGDLPLLAAGAATADEAIARVAEAPGVPEDFSPFKLVAVDARGRSRALHWDGRRLHARDEVVFETSSSFAPAEVRRAREAAHGTLAASASGRSASALERLHWTHQVEAGPSSVRVHRSDAGTRSVCAVRVALGADGKIFARLAYTAVDWSRSDGLGARLEVCP